MAANLGAHEVMEIHEVLTDTIDGINQFQLYRPYVKDQELLGILDRQLQFMNQEYNNMVQAVNQQGNVNISPYRKPRNISPNYGLNNPSSQSPNLSADDMDDRDVSSGMLGCHKASACLKLRASLECAEPQIRKMILQAATNSAEQAYEVWQYMHQKGFYQIPTMKDQTTSTIMGTYTAANIGENYQPQFS